MSFTEPEPKIGASFFGAVNPALQAFSKVGTALGANFAQDPRQRELYQLQQQQEAQADQQRTQAGIEMAMSAMDDLAAMAEDPQAPQAFQTPEFQKMAARTVKLFRENLQLGGHDPNIADMRWAQIMQQATMPRQEDLVEVWQNGQKVLMPRSQVTPGTAAGPSMAESTAADVDKARQTGAIDYEYDVKRIGAQGAETRRNAAHADSLDDAQPSDKQQQVAALMARGISQADAEDIANDLVRVTVNPVSGKAMLVNIATGVTKPLEPPAAGAAPAASAPQLEPVEDATSEGTGVASNVFAGLNATIGQLIPGGTLFPETADARQRLRLFEREAQRALILNERFATTEQAFIRDMVPSPDRLLADPDVEIQNIQKLRAYLVDLKRQNSVTLQEGNVTADEEGRLIDRNAAIDSVLALMGESGGGDDLGIPKMTLDQLQKLDPANMSAEQLKAASERYRVLGGQ